MVEIILASFISLSEEKRAYSLQYQDITVYQQINEQMEGEEEPIRSNIIYINPFSFLFGILNAEYQRRINESFGIILQGYYTRLGIFGLTYTGFGFGALLGYYWERKALEGWHVAGGISTMILRVAVELLPGQQVAESVTLFSIPAFIGYTWVFGKGKVGFALSLGGGTQILVGAIALPLPYLRISLGVGF